MNDLAGRGLSSKQRRISLQPVALITFFGALLGGLLAWRFGLPPEWDMLNYHLYNPHAWLTGRQAIDVAPAQLQTYLNPLFHVPHYFFFRHLPQGWMVFITGAVQGSQLVLLWAILKQLCGEQKFPSWLLPGIALLGLGGPIFLYELGTSQGDTLLSLPVLLAIWLVLIGSSGQLPDKSLRNVVLAGILLGCVTALKLVFAIYGIALGLAVLMAGPRGLRVRLFLVYTLACFLSFLAVGGAWFAHSYSAYQNPLFPYFNSLFQSPFLVDLNFRDLRFMPAGAVDWLAYPLVWLRDPLRVWELPFRDIRVVVLYPLLFLVPVIFWKRLGNTAPGLRIVLLFLATSYILWLSMFSIYRYLAVVEMLAPIVLFAALVYLTRNKKALLIGAVGLAVSQLLVEFDRLQPIPELRADSASTLAQLPPHSLVLANGYEPLGYLALWLDDEVPLVRTRANFLYFEEPQSRIRLEAEERVRNHSGPLFMLWPATEKNAVYLAADLQRMGLAIPTEAACKPVFADQQLQARLAVELCELQRLVANPLRQVSDPEFSAPAEN